MAGYAFDPFAPAAPAPVMQPQVIPGGQGVGYRTMGAPAPAPAPAPAGAPNINPAALFGMNVPQFALNAPVAAPTPAPAPARVAPRPVARSVGARAAVTTAQSAGVAAPAQGSAVDSTLFDPFNTQPGAAQTAFAAGAPQVPYQNGVGVNASAPRTSAGLTDPSAAIAVGYDQQLAYQHAALQAIMDAARMGNPDNYSYRLGHLVAAMGNNDFAHIQEQGATGINSALSGIEGAGIYGGAQRYSADQRRIAAEKATEERAAEPKAAGTVSELTTHGQRSINLYQQGNNGPLIATPLNHVIPTVAQFETGFAARNPRQPGETPAAYAQRIQSAYKKTYGQ